MNAPSCFRCGQPVTPGARFCTRCGADVSGEQGNVATARMPSVPMEESGIEILRRATLGEYDIMAELGRGGMATVYLAHEISLDRKVAIKVMAPQLMFGEGMAERFRREARTAASLSHPHIIPIYAVKESGRVLYFVMKFVAGRPLDDIIREVGPLPIPMVRAILSQVGSALGYAHRRGIIHRDIKPANIMIDDEGWAIVTDFGIAKVAETQGLTMTGVAVGTPSYMSPEQCAAKEVTGRSDQYSLGVVAYEMVTGKQPFVADTAMAIMWQHFNDAPRPLRELRTDCPPELESTILRMMEKQPDRRWGSIEDAVTAIGATPLAHDDPVRLQMVGLAQSSLNQRLLDEMKTPTSLVPPTRASGKQATEVVVVGSVAISPRSARLAAGETLQLTAMVQDARGETMTGRKVAWSSSNSAVASVSESGMVAALIEGEITVSAECDGHSGSCQLVITPAPVAAVMLSPADGTLEAGATLELTASVKNAQQKLVKDRKVTWTSSAPAVATVSDTGVVTGVAPGGVKITATCEGKSATASLAVVEAAVAQIEIKGPTRPLEVGESARLSARLLDARKRELTRDLTWSIKPAGIAQVDANGELTALAEGRTAVIVQAGQKDASFTLAVVAAAVATVRLAPERPGLEAGQSLQLKATLLDKRGRELTDRAIKWSSSREAVATVDQSGKLTGVGAGTARITAAAGAAEASVDCTVAAAPRPAPPPEPVAAAPRVTTPPEVAAPAVQEAATEKLPSQPARAEPRPAPVPEPVPAQRKSKVPLAIAALVILGALLVWQFGPWKGGVAAGPAVSLVATPAAQTLNVGDSIRMAVEFRDAAGHPVESSEPVTWSSDNPAVAAISGDFVRAVAGGTATIIGESRGLRATTALTVAGAAAAGRDAVSSLVLDRPPGNLSPGQTLQLSATPRDAGGGTLAGRPVNWTSSNQAVVTVTPTGLLSARGPGTATITATSEGKSVTAEVTVAPAAVAAITVTPSRISMETGETLALAAEARDARGQALAGRTIQWSSSNPGVATVANDGQVKAVATGSATITADADGKRATAAVTVVTTRVDVASVTLSPTSGTLVVGERLQLDAALRDGRGGAIRDRTPAWTSSDPSVATVSSSGQVTAVGVGSATITASSDNQRAVARIEVTRAPVASVALTQPPASLPVGESFQVGATVRDSRGDPVTDRPVAWSTSNARVATVSNGGVVTAVGQGTARITATVEGRNASVNVTVPAPVLPVARLEVSPAASLTVGESAQLSANPVDARGGTLDRPVTWTSSNPNVATVSRTGQVSAVAAGSAIITAAAEGRSATIAVAVTAKADPDAGAGGGPVAGGGGGAIPRISIAAAGNFSCGLVAGGALACWGGGSSTPAILGDQRFSRIVGGQGHACGLTSAGAAWCWGQNSRGQLGDGTSAGPKTEPVAVAGGLTFRVLRAGDNHTCGVAGNGKAYCWGDGSNGQLGEGGTSSKRRPVPVADLSFTDIATGGNHTCGIATDGKTWCWGDGFSGQLGYGNLSTETLPVSVDAGTVKFTRIYAGGTHSCALTAAGKAYCWGDNRNGQVGDGSTSDRRRPVEVSTTVTFEELSLGNTHSCGRTGGGQVYCWGNNGRGQLGTGNRTSQNRPTRIASDESFASISAGGSHTCGSTGTAAYCWGENVRGQLGDGTTTPRLTPVAVLGAN